MNTSHTRLRLNEVVRIAGRSRRVTELSLQNIPAIRKRLIDIAESGGTITYGQLIKDLKLSYAQNGLGPVLDLLSEDCARRDEPSLAAVVVSDKTGEVGDSFTGDPVAERQLVFEHWSVR